MRKIFDDKSVAIATGVPLEMIVTGYCDSYLYRGIPYGSALRFCGKCLAEGYHSPIHQLLYLERCPYHSTMIRDTCVQCDRRINAGFGDSLVTNPFECSFCKTRLYHIEKASNLPQNQSISGSYEKLGRILVNRAKCTPVIVPMKNDPGYQSEFVWSMWENAYDGEAKGCDQEQGTIVNHIYSNNGELCYERAYRAVRRRLRSDVLMAHGDCLKNLLAAPWVDKQYQIDRTDRYCPYAQAYIDWEIRFGRGEFGQVITRPKMSYEYSMFSIEVTAIQMEIEFYNSMKNIAAGPSWGRKYRDELKKSHVDWILCEANEDKQARRWRLISPYMDINYNELKEACERGMGYFHLDHTLYAMKIREMFSILRRQML